MACVFLPFRALSKKFHKKTSSLQSSLPDDDDDDVVVASSPDDDDDDDDDVVVGSSPVMISELPDDILISIISLLPIKSAIHTSILSNRWRHLHKSLSHIHLDCQHLLGPLEGDHKSIDPNLLINSLQRFVGLRSGSKIHSFNLNCCLHDDSVLEKLDQCIRSVGKSGIEKLVLSFRCQWGNEEDHPFYYHVISEIPSLRCFELSYCTMHPSLKPQCNSYSLKTISLDSVTLLPGAMECVLSSCLQLQTLSIARSKSPSKLCFRGPRLQLKALVITSCEGIEEIEIYATNLVVFEFENIKVVNFIFDHAPQLHSLYIHIIDEGKTMPYVVWKLSNDLPHLKSLNYVARRDTFQGINNMFGNLRTLDLSLCGILKLDFLMVTPLLQSCPLLQDFHLHACFSIHYEPQGNKPAVAAPHSELKKMEISGFAGTENDIKFALHILKSATNLERMLISRCSKVYNGYGKWAGRSVNPDPWSEFRHTRIQRRLQGQAISKSAQVIIQDEAYIEDDYSWSGDCSIVLV